MVRIFTIYRTGNEPLAVVRYIGNMHLIAHYL